MVHACNHSYLWGWGGMIAWAWEVEAAGSCDHTTAPQPEQWSETLSQKLKLKYIILVYNTCDKYVIKIILIIWSKIQNKIIKSVYMLFLILTLQLTDCPSSSHYLTATMWETLSQNWPGRTLFSVFVFVVLRWSLIPSPKLECSVATSQLAATSASWIQLILLP